jgi:hypothetical protein
LALAAFDLVDFSFLISLAREVFSLLLHWAAFCFPNLCFRDFYFDLITPSEKHDTIDPFRLNELFQLLRRGLAPDGRARIKDAHFVNLPAQVGQSILSA